MRLSRSSAGNAASLCCHVRLLVGGEGNIGSVLLWLNLEGLLYNDALKAAVAEHEADFAKEFFACQQVAERRQFREGVDSSHGRVFPSRRNAAATLRGSNLRQVPMRNAPGMRFSRTIL